VEIRDWVVKWLGHRLSRLFVSEWEEGGGRREETVFTNINAAHGHSFLLLFLIYFMSEIIPFVV
jgi:hypothetical protein